tara:strand:- start:86 stop:292 length:207 start_codon:yes stop_codon:yes gene_type:complete
VKKDNQHPYQANKNFEKNKDIEIDKIKTTNVNILLNRVRLDQKKQIKKKIILTLLIFCISSLIAVAIL